MKLNGQQTATKPPVIEIAEMNKVYKMGGTEVHALRGVSLTITEGEYVAIIGTSGSGKSTLMNMIGLLDKPTTGSYRIRGVETSKIKWPTCVTRKSALSFSGLTCLHAPTPAARLNCHSFMPVYLPAKPAKWR